MKFPKTTPERFPAALPSQHDRHLMKFPKTTPERFPAASPPSNVNEIV
jgi:hypothetical protein